MSRETDELVHTGKALNKATWRKARVGRAAFGRDGRGRPPRRPRDRNQPQSKNPEAAASWAGPELRE